eukprot:1932821-Amphidinium_carterae.1
MSRSDLLALLCRRLEAPAKLTDAPQAIPVEDKLLPAKRCQGVPALMMWRSQDERPPFPGGARSCRCEHCGAGSENVQKERK